MPIDYDAISQENEKRYGTDIDQYGPVLLEEDLHKDQTHFIFELLQNAEDAQATKAHFRLYPDRLELEHNGRPFNEADVRSICSIAKSTKHSDDTKIGMYGIGFKSVYTHTSSPEIHSKNEHFAIYNYVHPRLISSNSTTDQTLFVIRFNHVDKLPEESYRIIAKGLQDLGARTLLFLRNIDEIAYSIEDDLSGTYHRQTDNLLAKNFAKSVVVFGNNAGLETKENWLIFERNVAHLADNKHEISENSVFAVQIAFLVSDYEENGRPNIVKLPQISIYVFFPTGEEINLGFLIHGPYKTTISRSEISDKEVNIKLAKETGELVVEALRWLRDREWLTAKVLTTMPLEHSFYNSIYDHIYDRVKTAIIREALIPAYKTGYVSGSAATIAESRAVRNLLNESHLKLLFSADKQIRWISDEITRGQTPTLYHYLTRSGQINVDVIDSEKFAEKIDKNFLEQQSDDWIQKFYEVASEFGSRSNSYSSPFNTLKRKEIIRLTDSNHVEPFDWNNKPQAFLPSEYESRFPTVKCEVCNSDQAKLFLKNLGLNEPDVVDEVLTDILPKYKAGQKIDDVEHTKDSELIFQAMGEESISIERRNKLVSELNETPFLSAENSFGNSAYCKPRQVYFRVSDLESYFKGNPEGYFLLSKYDDFEEQLAQLDINYDIRVSNKGNERYGYVTLSSPWGDRGSKYDPYVRGKYGFDPNCAVDGLDFALKNPDATKSAYIWNEILIPNKNCISGVVEKSTRWDFTRIFESNQEVSKMGALVREQAWLPDGSGNFVKPSELSLKDLPDGFRKDKDLADALGMKVSETSIQDLLRRDDIAEDVKQTLELAKEFTVEDLELLELLKKYPNLIDQLRKKDRENIEILDIEEIPAKLRERFEQPITSSNRRHIIQDRLDEPDITPKRGYSMTSRTNQNPKNDPKLWPKGNGGKKILQPGTFWRRNTKGAAKYVISLLSKRTRHIIFKPVISFHE